MAFKVFTTGEVLTAANVNDYLMEQVVITCTSSTRPSSPNEGMAIYETDTKNFLIYNGSVWIPHLPKVFARKTANETVNSSTTYQADNHMVVSVVANAVYMVTLQLLMVSPAAADFKLRLVLPSGAVADSWSLNIVGGIFWVVPSMTTGFTLASTGTDQMLLYTGLIVMGGTSGSATVEWAQLASDAGNTTVQTHSFFCLERVA